MTEQEAAQLHIRQLREQAGRLAADARRSGDDAERARLQRQARQLESDSDQESMMAAGDIYPAQ
ncbi:MAG: small hydrophilic protein [Streptomyces sp.]|nr:small hydrophilic protein [Streptomyces sp.]